MTDYKQRLDELVKLRGCAEIYNMTPLLDALTLAEELHAEVERLQKERDIAMNSYAGAIQQSEDENAIHRIVRTENERLKAEVERLMLAQTWQPIETAPKDWSDVLVYVPEGENQKGRWHEEKIWTAYFSGEDGGWNCWCVDGKKMENQPTHWMPLPTYEQARGGE